MRVGDYLKCVSGEFQVILAPSGLEDYKHMGKAYRLARVMMRDGKFDHHLANCSIDSYRIIRDDRIKLSNDSFGLRDLLNMTTVEVHSAGWNDIIVVIRDIQVMK